MVQPNVVTNHAIEIPAAAADVWPWLVQIGQGRGGFYSYSFFENLIGCRIKNADRIHEAWQTLAVGDSISLHPSAKKLTVAELEPNQHLVLTQEEPFCWSWSFNLIPITAQTCRLLIRTRVRWKQNLAGWLLRPLMTVGHYVMERKMLTGIRQRVTRNSSGHPSPWIESRSQN